MQKPLDRDQTVHAVTAAAHLLEAAAHLLMCGKDVAARDAITEAYVVTAEVLPMNSAPPSDLTKAGSAAAPVAMNRPASAPTENSSLLHEASGNLSYLLSIARVHDLLSVPEESNVQRVIERLEQAKNSPISTPRGIL